MSKRAALLQADVRRVIRAARQEGVAEVEVRQGDTAVIMRLKSTGDDKALEPEGEIDL